MSKRRKRRERGKALELKGYEEPQPVKKHKEQEKGIKGFYKKRYKLLMIIPFTLFLVAIISIIVNISSTGELIPRGVSLKGGLTLTIETGNSALDITDVETFLNSKISNDVLTREIKELGVQRAISVEAAVLPGQSVEDLEKQIIGLLKDKYSITEYSSETIGPSLGESFFRQTLTAIVVAFILMAIIVFIVFKTFAPSMAVVLAAFSDIIITVAVVDIIGMKISTAGIAAFLMLVGYSVDTDILLSTRVLKRKEGTVFDRTLSAFKTGITMSITTIAAVTIALILTQSEVIRQIMIIILIGLLADIINTWLQNAGILRWYLERKRQ